MKLKKTTVFSIVLIFLMFFEFVTLFNRLFSKVSYVNVSQQNKNSITEEIKQGDIIEQSFVSNEDNISSIEILSATFNRVNSGKIQIGIKEQGKEDSLFSTLLDTSLIKDNEYIVLNFDTIRQAKNKKYSIYVKSIDGKENNAIALYSSKEDLYKNGELIINGKNIHGDLVFNIKSKTPYPRSYILLSVLLFTAMIAIFILIKKKNISLHKAFLVFTIVYGMIFFFVIPPSQAPDEPVHLYRAYEISTGNMISIKENNRIGNHLPKSLLDMLLEIDHNKIAMKPEGKVNYDKFKKAFSIKLNPNDTSFYDFGGASVYVPIQYIPQSFGLLIARIFNTSALSAFYLAKFFNFITWIVLVYYSIKIIPYGKEIMFTIALMPITMQQAVSISPDVMIIALSFLFIAHCLKYNKSPETFGKRQKIFISILGISIAVIKIVYLPIILLLLILPKEKFKSKINYYAYLILSIIISIGLTGAWMMYVNSHFTLSSAPFPGVNTTEQIKFAITNPIRYSFIVRNTLVRNLNFYIESGVGIIGWIDTHLPYSVILSYLITLVLLAFFSETVKDSSKRVLFSIICFFAVILIFSSLYAGWTPVAHPYIDGVQGRYLIPILPLLMLCGPNIETNINKSNMNKYLFSFLNWALAYSLIIIFSRYFIY